MDIYEKQRIVNRIITGIIYLNINGKLYKLVSPTYDDIALAQLVYEDVLNNSKFEQLITREVAANILKIKGIWTGAHETRHKDLMKRQEDLKIELYKMLYNSKKQKLIRKQLKSVDRAITKGYIKKYSLDHMTLEHHAETLYDEFLTAICIYNSNGDKIYTYDSFFNDDNYILQRFIHKKEQLKLDQGQYREIARTEPFRSLWTIGKEKVFGVNSAQLTYDQKSLILYSRMYDNVYESLDTPSDDVINDDDMLDGWFALQHREREKERKQKEVDKLLGKKGVKDGTGEAFVVVDSKEEAQKIQELNDLNTKMKLQQRFNTIKEKGRIEEQDLPDVKLELRQQAMKEMADKIRGK